jgi:3-deoxy-D-manno-octulosonate 8-phosphate phosphatase (KDO 8-P phosphatase)
VPEPRNDCFSAESMPLQILDVVTTPIEALALDVDGVLTDGGFYLGPNGEEWKRFCFADVMGISLARKAGLIVALISGEDSPLVSCFANKLGISDVERGCKDKAQAVRTVASRYGIVPSQMCFMGDDVNDLSAMELCGFTAAPADARQVVRDQVDFVTETCGGNGAVREIVDLLLRSAHQSTRVSGLTSPRT